MEPRQPTADDWRLRYLALAGALRLWRSAIDAIPRGTGEVDRILPGVRAAFEAERGLVAKFNELEIARGAEPVEPPRTIGGHDGED